VGSSTKQAPPPLPRLAYPPDDATHSVPPPRASSDLLFRIFHIPCKPLNMGHMRLHVYQLPRLEPPDILQLEHPFGYLESPPRIIITLELSATDEDVEPSLAGSGAPKWPKLAHFFLRALWLMIRCPSHAELRQGPPATSLT